MGRPGITRPRFSAALTTPSQRPRRSEDPLIATARRWWQTRYGAPASGGAFERAIPEELVGEMLTELWERRDSLEERLADPLWEGDREILSRELASIEEALGLREDGDTVRTGDPLIDYLIARHLSGEITPEDLEMTEDDLKSRR